MRFGKWRGMVPVLAFALAAVTVAGLVATPSVRAGLICHTITREVTAVDVHTGGPYSAPPVPNGLYTCDVWGSIAEACGLIRGSLCLPGLCHSGDPCNACGSCGEVGNGCGFCGWKSLLHGCPSPGLPCDGGLCSTQNPGKSCSFVGKATTVCPSMQSPIVSPQAPCASPQALCSKPGCILKLRHFHKMGNGCNACGGSGCGICHGGGMLSGKLCNSCGGNGCGLCGGLGLLGCGAGGGSKLLGLAAKVLHIGDIEYFVGPGGPVPITPGYVPYVVTTRSPRDFFAFPPFSQTEP
jgi:hypothetical protein